MTPTPEANGEPLCVCGHTRTAHADRCYHGTCYCQEYSASPPPAQGGDVAAHPAVDLLRDWLIQFIARNAEAEAEGFPCREPCYFVPEQARKLLIELGAALDARPSPPQEVETLRQALQDAVDDAEARWDMDSPSLNPGIKAWVERGREALALVPPPQGAPEASIEALVTKWLGLAAHPRVSAHAAQAYDSCAQDLRAALQRARETGTK